jgi:hypothetical protein
MVDLLAFLRGRWSNVPPMRAGLYFMRIGTATPAHVGQWDPAAPEGAATATDKPPKTVNG